MATDSKPQKHNATVNTSLCKEAELDPIHQPKPVLIINCSDKKVEHETNAFDLYLGDIFKVIRANTKDRDIRDMFNVFILSAKHGLLSSADTVKPYNQRMPKRSTIARRKGIAEFAETHKTKAAKLLKQHQGGDLVVMLSFDYLTAFDLMFYDHKLKEMFDEVVISRTHRGHGDMKKALIAEITKTKIINSHKKSDLIGRFIFTINFDDLSFRHTYYQFPLDNFPV
ncbi:peroxide stress protein YaaA [Photobacterium leiognathi]|uniref:peroxide stress protein YaaA n=1 Tax=Photobacterium leiognathi TaxID=553611 RepID=UPI001EDF95AD|nr:peroxide stress protein YaaA [Photobacterium leiognathi]MCG3884544.1 peroxide stress protein YaaA [Photobacterium leiognathi]